MLRSKTTLVLYSFAIVCALFVTGCVLTGCSSSNPSHSDMVDRGIYEATEKSDRSKASNDLVVSGVSIRSNNSYTQASGSITNRGNDTVTFVEVKGLFQDSYGSTVDTDWTYAVGSEGLSPGESSKFTLSVDKDSSIKSCSVFVVDFDS